MKRQRCKIHKRYNLKGGETLTEENAIIENKSDDEDTENNVAKEGAQERVDDEPCFSKNN